MRVCWCGNADLTPFGPEYGECQACGTLVYLKDMPPEQLLVRDDETDFYGKKYWLEHQQETFGYADIYTRARNDLIERNLHWLKTLLKYRLPPAKVLELGCSHGSFVALMRQAGFDAAGVEMSPWVVEFGQKTFGVPISVGPVEALDIAPGSLDVIALMDVLEHLPNPLATMDHCLQLLKPDGILLIQTPQFKEGMTYSALIETNGPFLEQLKADEHLYLFSDRSVTRLFQQLGAEYIQFEPAIFGHYDMFFAVSRAPLQINTPEQMDAGLLATPNGRLALALLDLRERELDLTRRLQESEADRAARWEQIETLTRTVTGGAEKIEMTARLKTIAVDLTPILPGGENGGAKIFVLELLRRLGAMHPETRFILLTQAASHEELASMDSVNISRRMVVGPTVTKTLRPRLEGLARCLLPHLPIRLRRLVMALGYRLNTALKRGGSSTLLSDMGADLLFCPFTAPTYFEPGIPTVCTIYDLQYKTYPEFFAPEDVAHRDQTFIEACRCANALTAISDYSREAAIRHGNLAPDRIRTIHLRMAQRIAARAGERMDLLDRLGLRAGRYLIYPANFWRHKNHEMLLTALGMACRAGLAADIKLVCTGASGERQQYLAQAAAAMGLKERTIFPGFLPNDELAALLANARGMVFPSLYEGFGLPVVEAMAAGIPVACSNLTSLPEVAADAAVLFDPRIPTQIAEALITLVEDEATRSRLIATGRQRAAGFADSDRMAREYWDLFLYAADQGLQTDLLTGVHPDGWCGPQLTLRLARVDAERTLELKLAAPEFLPAAKIQVMATLNGNAPRTVFELTRGSEGSVSIPLADVEALQLQITPAFVPSHHGINEDSRELTLQLRQCTLRAADGTSRRLYPESNDSQDAGIESQ